MQFETVKRCVVFSNIYKELIDSVWNFATDLFFLVYYYYYNFWPVQLIHFWPCWYFFFTMFIFILVHWLLLLSLFVCFVKVLLQLSIARDHQHVRTRTFVYVVRHAKVSDNIFSNGKVIEHIFWMSVAKIGFWENVHHKLSWWWSLHGSDIGVMFGMW